jgi:hypothetical protein
MKIMRQLYVQKKGYFRHLCTTLVHQLTSTFYSYLADIPKEQIAIGKGFSVHRAVINCIFKVNYYILA